KRILEVTGKDTLLDVWPNLELFIHGGVSFGPYREQYHKVIPSSSMRYMETYNASEGFFAFQDDLSRNDMMLLLDHGIFFEFVPMEELDSETPKAYTVAEIEPGKNYAIVISTNSGLWRYLVGDTVVFTSTFPHRVKISGRTRHFINAFGEEVIVENADAAIKAACEKTGALVKEYTAGPIFMTDTTKGAHEWLVEFETAPDDLESFVTVLDEKLCSVNSDYEAKRYKGITLDRPVVHVLKEGVFYSWLHSKGKLGGQNKIPRLFNSRDYVNELLDLNESM
ncbi:MAG TPA: GH3 auxin-responsive promoter family protein, partial [Williamwhitmania sp.]|nr:GH3 auxin-responsive promoter family protein [Williamwhitmania sp.]